MMMAFYLFCVCVALQVGLSYLLPKLPDEDRQRLYWAPAGCPEIGRLARTGRLSVPGRAGGLGHGESVRGLSLGGEIRPDGAWLTRPRATPGTRLLPTPTREL